MLNISNLVKVFGEKRAVDNVSFSIDKGEIFALIGPNGSGKTTIIKSIVGLLAPTSGSIVVDNHSITAEPEAAKSVIGYVPDEPTVWDRMTGEELLHFTGALFGVPESERTSRIGGLMQEFDLNDLREEYFGSFSRGNKQKFAILSALLHRPKLLLIDEPIVGLDPRSADKAKQLLARTASEGGSVLLVTHTLPVAEEIAHRIGVLYQGKLVATGTLAELRSEKHLHADASLEDVYRAYTT
jgi:ABC-2 type transport system ATP-binding protein